MFRDEPLYTTPQFNMVLNHAALGDMIASLPAVVYARRMTAKEQKINVWVPEHQIPLVRHLVSHEIPAHTSINVLPIHRFKELATHEDPEVQHKVAGPCVMNNVMQNTVTRNKIDMVEYAYLTLLDRMPLEAWERNYPHTAPIGPRKIDGPYVVLPVNGTSPNKTPSADWAEEMIMWCHVRGVKPVITGKKDTIVKVVGEDKPVPVTSNYDKVPESVRAHAIDTRDTLDLMELRDLCAHASAVAGWDGGTVHVAGTTCVPIVYGLTTIKPVHRPIWRFDHQNWKLIHVEPQDLKCSGCQSRMNVMFGHDFRKCVYEDNLCVDRLKASDFIDGLKSLGI